MRILISDQNLGDDAQFEREAAETAAVEIMIDLGFGPIARRRKRPAGRVTT
jgi:hypothetical protein